MAGRLLRVLSRLVVLAALLPLAACVHETALRGGVPVKVSEVLAKARAEAAQRGGK